MGQFTGAAGWLQDAAAPPGLPRRPQPYGRVRAKRPGMRVDGGCGLGGVRGLSDTTRGPRPGMGALPRIAPTNIG